MINYVVTNSLYVVTNDTWKTIDHSIKCITFAMIVKQNKYVNHPQPTKSGKTKCARFEKRNVQKSGKTKRSKNFAHTTL